MSVEFRHFSPVETSLALVWGRGGAVNRLYFLMTESTKSRIFWRGCVSLFFRANPLIQYKFFFLVTIFGFFESIAVACCDMAAAHESLLLKISSNKALLYKTSQQKIFAVVEIMFNI